jgi:hypothetical protein
MTTKSKATPNDYGKSLDDTKRPVWLEATESFYRNRCVRLCGRTATGLWIIRFEWTIRADTVPRFCWSPDHRGPGQRLMPL